MNDDPRAANPPPLRNDPMEVEVKRDLAPLDQFAECAFSAESVMHQLVYGHMSPGDAYCWLRDLQVRAFEDLPQFFPDPAKPPFEGAIAFAAAQWQAETQEAHGANVVNLEAMRALKKDPDNA